MKVGISHSVRTFRPGADVVFGLPRSVQRLSRACRAIVARSSRPCRALVVRVSWNICAARDGICKLKGIASPFIVPALYRERLAISYKCALAVRWREECGAWRPSRLGRVPPVCSDADLVDHPGPLQRV